MEVRLTSVNKNTPISVVICSFTRTTISPSLRLVWEGLFGSDGKDWLTHPSVPIGPLTANSNMQGPTTVELH